MGINFSVLTKILDIMNEICVSLSRVRSLWLSFIWCFECKWRIIHGVAIIIELFHRYFVAQR